MKCERCCQYLYDFADGTLPATLMDEIRVHLGGCPACREFYEQDRKLSDDFRQTAASLDKRLHFEFLAPDPAGFGSSQTRRRAVPWRLTWATVAVTVVALIVLAWVLCFPPWVRQPEERPYVRNEEPKGGGKSLAVDESKNGNGIIQIISIEDDSCQLSEFYFRQENQGLTTDITVEVAAFHVINSLPAKGSVVSQ